MWYLVCHHRSWHKNAHCFGFSQFILRDYWLKIRPAMGRPCSSGRACAPDTKGWVLSSRSSLTSTCSPLLPVIIYCISPPFFLSTLQLSYQIQAQKDSNSKELLWINFLTVCQNSFWSISFTWYTTWDNDDIDLFHLKCSYSTTTSINTFSTEYNCYTHWQMYFCNSVGQGKWLKWFRL